MATKKQQAVLRAFFEGYVLNLRDHKLIFPGESKPEIPLHGSMINCLLGKAKWSEFTGSLRPSLVEWSEAHKGYVLTASASTAFQHLNKPAMSKAATAAFQHIGELDARCTADQATED
jgi:hypothetical protein